MTQDSALPADRGAWRRASPADTGAVELDPGRDFASVYEVCYPAVYRTVRGVVLDPHMAEDVTQDAFLKAYRARGRYRPTGRVEGWLCTIAVREAISRLRWAGLQRRLLDRGRRHAQEPGPPAGLAARLDELLAVLSPRQRAVVVLHYLHGYRYREIATMLRMPEGTVASRLSQAMAVMRERATRPDESGADERWTRQKR
jgi:RNA polymerase sigma-70 factor (ECF subfamily)